MCIWRRASPTTALTCKGTPRLQRCLDTSSWPTTNGWAWARLRTWCKHCSCKEGWCHRRSLTSSSFTCFVIFSQVWWPHCLQSQGKAEAQWRCMLSSLLPSQVTMICYVDIVPCLRGLIETLHLMHKTLSTLPVFIRAQLLIEEIQYILYCTLLSPKQRLSHIDFCLAVASHLLASFTSTFTRHTHPIDDSPSWLTGRHFLGHYDKGYPDCKICSCRWSGKRKQIKFYCKQWNIHVALCPCPCFERYHTLVNYKQCLMLNVIFLLWFLSYVLQKLDVRLIQKKDLRLAIFLPHFRNKSA